MGRAPQPEIRARLLGRCTDAVLADGLPAGLAPLAAATGTSARMLLYHFGTRDRLLREVLQEARARQLELFRGALAPADEPYPKTLRRAWHLMTGPEAAPFLRLFGRVYAAPRVLWPDFRRGATTDWLDVLTQGLGGDAALASVGLAVLRGLLRDREDTGDTARTEQAFEAFARLLEAAG